ncbi:MAG: hypothetical protein OXG82_19585 [Gammaproteobacteria bacterium]|nr:hypothetical protein [Gammaproteobacteria bacterium]
MERLGEPYMPDLTLKSVLVSVESAEVVVTMADSEASRRGDVHKVTLRLPDPLGREIDVGGLIDEAVEVVRRDRGRESMERQLHPNPVPVK